MSEVSTAATLARECPLHGCDIEIKGKVKFCKKHHRVWESLERRLFPRSGAKKVIKKKTKKKQGGKRSKGAADDSGI